MSKDILRELCAGLPVSPLPPWRPRDETVAHAPNRTPNLSPEDKKLALRNALRYFPAELHSELVEEFARELKLYGHIYMYRLLPQHPIRAYPINDYPAKCRHAAAIMHMIMNNLDPKVAQFPQELVTYGGNGQVFSNWAQFWLTLHYLSTMTSNQTLVMYSGHPHGLFPSSEQSPRLVITNGMMVPNYSSREIYEKLFALGVTMYGQMTAGSYCYIGPQGIVHGTTLTVMNAGRLYLKADSLSGKVFITSGLGGMSGAQAKAAVICGCVGVVAEVSKEALIKRHKQGWLMEWTDDLNDLVSRIRQAKLDGRAASIGYHGNIISLWEKLAEVAETTGELLADLGSDQTSLHNPFLGGYFPVEVSYEESLDLMHKNTDRFKSLVESSLRRHVAAINKLTEHGMYFWDYGNAFLLEARRAGADVLKANPSSENDFKYPSYVQHIMGDIFSLGFGPFRWVCTSGKESDLQQTDRIAADVLTGIIKKGGVSQRVVEQYKDNIRWIEEAEKHKLVVGSQARILYADQRGRSSIALAFNSAIASGQITGPVVLSRDHHDVSGTDSPYRETSNIYDGSSVCADMAVQNVIGDSFRGATWVAIHNGGGVGWGEVMNGGFGLVLDGSEEAGERARSMLQWDVSNGVARRCWTGNSNAEETIQRAMRDDKLLRVTMPVKVERDDLIDKAIKNAN